MRDIRQLDQAYAESTDASLVIRQHAILVNVGTHFPAPRHHLMTLEFTPLMLDPIRAVILRNQFIVLLGTTNTVDSLMDQLQQRVQAYLRESPGTAFEFTALEGLLSTITSWLAMKCAGLKPTVETSLASFARAERPRDEFEQVRNVQTAVTTLHVQVSGIRGMLMTLLDDEADLCMMHLTKLAQSLDQQVVDLDEVESVLETNLQDVFGTLASISMLLSKIDNTQRMVDLAWTSKRNYLLVVDMSLKFMFLGVLVTHLWTGMFGQNLESHVKEDGMWFAATFGGCSIWIVGFYVVVYVYFKSKNIALSWRKPGFVAPED
ncbi:hypothetical protein DYB37_006641 [Aphanomyces astaci]|uniref:Magnesium transporter n=1 Tax=Aphanomyces astaci TaxID=112090 RepID=A0A3L6V3V2_APHAT|nr:hypothetical protein DYB34_007895 [Aphanomyces astaci]RHY96488.1 hypothetical protein DYB35_005993 [Aphanomyces astaci]RHZ27055.1 hypothetical protein DYB37_006641 [Aphanomyces astaci]RLO03555.1 hypothetical protein DYB28_000471 [Aphanomyces astaci]